MDLNLEIKKYRHVWCIGCSFTSYKWPTWADHLKDKFGNVTNLGMAGAGNYYIFHNILEKFSLGEIKSNDLIMICWSGYYRMDNKYLDKWYGSGNLLTQSYWPMEYVKKYCDPKFFLERDLYLILAINEIFRDRVVNFSMEGIERIDQYKNYKLPFFSNHNNNQKIKTVLDKFYPSFYKVLWNDDIHTIKNREDKHPTEEEHKFYLKKVFQIE